MKNTFVFCAKIMVEHLYVQQKQDTFAKNLSSLHEQFAIKHWYIETERW